MLTEEPAPEQNIFRMIDVLFNRYVVKRIHLLMIQTLRSYNLCHSTEYSTKAIDLLRGGRGGQCEA